MPKVIESLEFNTDFLKALVRDSKGFESLSNFADALGASKQTLNFWMQQGKMPAAKMHKAISLLALGSENVAKLIHQRKQYKVLFRTRRNIPVMASNKHNASSIGSDFFDWHEPTLNNKKKIHLIKSKNPIEFADKMKSQLGINDCSNLTTAGLVKILEKFNIHVLFVDFKDIFDFKDIKSTNQPCAFCLREDETEKYAIVVNIREHQEDMLWIIIHELTHIFAGDLDKHSEELVEDEEQEKFSNKVAVEFITPSTWFEERKSNLIGKFKTNSGLTVYYTEEIARKLNSSFMGVILALSNHQIISSHTKSYLMAVHHNKDKRGDRARIYQSIGSDYEANRYEFWRDAFKNIDSLNYLKFQNLIRKGLFEDSISTDRVSEILGLTDTEVAKLKGAWKNENRVGSDL